MNSPLVSLVLILGASTLRGAPADWLIDPAPFKATFQRRADGREAELNNGLVRRVFSLQAGPATVALDNLVTGEAVLRATGTPSGAARWASMPTTAPWFGYVRVLKTTDTHCSNSG